MGRPDRSDEDWRGFAIPLRIAAVFAVGAMATWDVVVPLPEGLAPAAVAVRTATIVIAVLAGLLTFATRRPMLLRLLAITLGLGAVAYNLWLLPQAPVTLPELLVVAAVVVMTGAVLIPWSWLWQASLVVLVVGGALVRMHTLTNSVFSRWLEWRLTYAMVAVAALSVVGAVTAQRERSRRKASEDREAASRGFESVARMAGRFAHEFNNLLGTVLANATLLHERQARGAADTSLDDIIAAAERGRELTRSLQRYTEHEAVSLQPVSPRRLAEDAARLIGRALPSRLTLRTDVPADVPTVAADPSHVVHALVELGLNARDAMGEQAGTIGLTARREDLGDSAADWPGLEPGSYVQFTVADAGPGLSPAARAQLFEPFFTTKTGGIDMGLGLASVQWVARAHAGGLRVESAPKQGTRVHLLIPVSAAAPVGPAASLSGVTVLIADDDATLRRATCRALTHFGARVLEAPDGDEAVRVLSAAAPPVDLVLLDVVMPSGGLVCYHALKAARPDVRVLVCTGYGPEGEASAMLEAGADGLLAKPFEIAELKQAAQAALARA